MKSQMPTPARRRTLWIGTASALAISLALAGCTAADTASPTSAMTSTATAGSGDVVALAKAFAATLSDDQTTELQQKYTFANASDWSNLPQALLTGGGFGGEPPAAEHPAGEHPAVRLREAQHQAAPAAGRAPPGASASRPRRSRTPSGRRWRTSSQQRRARPRTRASTRSSSISPPTTTSPQTEAGATTAAATSTSRSSAHRLIRAPGNCSSAATTSPSRTPTPTASWLERPRRSEGSNRSPRSRRTA